MTTYLDKAYEDVVAIESLSEHFAQNASIICYHAQQSIEKQLKHAMKTVIPEYADDGKWPPRTHDIGLLMSRLIASGAFEADEDSMRAASMLTSFEARARYPMGDTFAGEDAVEAVALHNRIADLLEEAGLPSIGIDMSEQRNLAALTGYGEPDAIQDTAEACGFEPFENRSSDPTERQGPDTP